jgi:hypothetical protein
MNFGSIGAHDHSLLTETTRGQVSLATCVRKAELPDEAGATRSLLADIGLLRLENDRVGVFYEEVA